MSLADHHIVTFSGEATPVIIILSAIYWTRSDGLTIAQAFTSLSIVMLSINPLIMLLASVISTAGLFGSFIRIQTFLLLDERRDARQQQQQSSDSQTIKTMATTTTNITTTSPLSSAELPLPLHDLPKLDGPDVELSTLRDVSVADTAKADTDDRPAARLIDVTFSVDESSPILSHVSMSIPRGSLTMVVGRVGCGKSSLLKTIIGELTPQQGTVTVTASAETMAYCDQTPWLQNVSVARNITVFTPLDEEWLWTVIRACALEEDISNFPALEDTLVGSGGVALSGGQKQRLVSCFPSSLCLFGVVFFYAV